MRTFRVPRDLPEGRARVNTLVTFRVSRIEPHENPNWLEPPEGFMGAPAGTLALRNDMGQFITDPSGTPIYVVQ